MANLNVNKTEAVSVREFTEPTGLRVSQQTVETLYTPTTTSVQVSQQTVETVYAVTAPIRASQQTVEVVRGPAPPLWVSQQIVEVIYPRQAFVSATETTTVSDGSAQDLLTVHIHTEKYDYVGVTDTASVVCTTVALHITVTDPVTVGGDELLVLVFAGPASYAIGVVEPVNVDDTATVSFLTAALVISVTDPVDVGESRGTWRPWVTVLPVPTPVTTNDDDILLRGGAPPMGLGFKWREPIRRVSPYLEEEFDSLYAALQKSAVWGTINYDNPTWLGTIDAEKVIGLYFNVKSYGAVGDNDTDDTLAIQTAINAAKAAGGGTVFFPDGGYRTSSTLVIDSDQIALRGASIDSAFIYPRGNFGDALYISPGCQRVGLFDLAIWGWGELTTGALVHACKADMIWMCNVELCSGYGGLWLESVQNSSFANLQIRSDSAFTAHRADSYLLRISQHATGVLPSEIHFVNCDWRGQAINRYLDYAILIEDGDGVFFSNVHVGMVNVAAIALKPSSATAQLTAIMFHNCYVDNTTNYGWLAQEPGGYSGFFGGHLWNGGIINSCGTGIYWDCTATVDSHIANVVCHLSTTTPSTMGAGGNKVRFSNCSYELDIFTVAADATNELALPSFGQTFYLSNAYPVSSIATSSAWKNRQVYLVATSTVTVNDGGNLHLAGNFPMQSDDVLTLVSDGTDWFEVSRSDN